MSRGKAPWRNDLQTSVRRLTYDFETRIGTLTLPPHCCTDMTGAIALFSNIDPRVEQVLMSTGEAVDTAYVRSRHQGWLAKVPR